MKKLTQLLMGALFAGNIFANTENQVPLSEIDLTPPKTEYMNVYVVEEQSEDKQRIEYEPAKVTYTKVPLSSTNHLQNIITNRGYFLEILDASTNVLERADMYSPLKKAEANNEVKEDTLYITRTSFKKDRRAEMIRIIDPEHNFTSRLFRIKKD